MESDERLLNELSAIRKLLTVLAQDKLTAFNEAIRSKYLTTEQRQKMYDLLDGNKGLREIGEEVGVSSEAVRQFAVSLEKAGLLEYVVINGKTKYPKRIF